MFDNKKNKNRRVRLKTRFVFIAILFASLVFLFPSFVQESKAAVQTIDAEQNTFLKNIFGIEEKILTVEEKEELEKEKEKAKRTAWAVAYKSALSQFLNTMAYDTAVWIASGGEGQQPMFYTEGWGAYLENIADDAAGEFINEFATANWGSDFPSLCEPDFDLKLQIGLGLESTIRPARAECSLTKMLDNWEEEFRDGNFLNNFSASFDPYSDDFGVTLTGYTQYFEHIEKTEKIAKETREEGWGFKAVQGLNEVIQTPGRVVGDFFQERLGGLTEAEGTPTGEAVADSIDMFLNTLVGQFLQNLMAGLWTGDSDSSSRYNYLSNTGETAATPGGRQAAEARFSGLLEVGRRVGGPYEILQKLIICQNESNPGPTDCVITEPFRRAIEREMTVQAAIDQGHLDGNAPFGFTPQGFAPSYKEGYPYRSILILRKYRIVPVGWEIAAEYINQFADQGILGLNNLIADYDNLASPYYGLIDPSWVLKAPELYCGLEGYGSIYSESVAPGTDANGDGDYSDEGDTPGQRNVFRNTYCADEQSCISEDEDGNCDYYGYCTKESRIWRFNGDTCPDYYNTCDTFTQNESGQTNSYLKNTLDFSSCNADNAGCQWYCTEYNAIDNIWTCEAEDERVSRRCESPGACSDSGDTCINDNQCSFNETCEDVGCSMQAACTIPAGEEECTDGELVLKHSCPSGGTDCDIDESCTVPYGGTSCVITGCDNSQSLVSNYSFEDAPTNFNEVALDWRGDRSNFLRVTGSTEKTKSGSYSTRFYSPGGNQRYHTTISDTITLAPGEYSMSGWFYDNLVTGESKAKIGLYAPGAADNSPLCETSINYSLHGEWLNLGCNYNNSSGGDMDVEIRLLVDSYVANSGPVGTVWFDNIYLGEECISQSVQLAFAGTVDKNQSKLYLDNDAQTCDAQEGGCSKFVRLQPGTNIVYNGSFEQEQDISYPVGLTPFIEWYGTGADTEITFNDEISYSGGKSMEINIETTTVTWPGLRQKTIFLKPDTEYIVSANIYIPNDSTISGYNWALGISNEECDWTRYPDPNSATGALFTNAQISGLGCTTNCTVGYNWCYFVYDQEEEQYMHSGEMTPGNNQTWIWNNTSERDKWIYKYRKIKTLPDIQGQAIVSIIGNNPNAVAVDFGTILVDDVQVQEITSPNSTPAYFEYGQTNITNLKEPPQYLNCTGDPANDVFECNNYALLCTENEVGCNLFTPVDGDPSVPAIVYDSDYCPAECVGYQAFKQTATNYESEKFPNYLIASTGEQCSSKHAGCEEFTNLDEVARGGEGREYYTYIRQCIKPNATECATYYTWVGSDEAGYQLRVYNLKRAVGDVEPEEVSTPRTDLGDCDLASDVIDNPHCKEFYAQDGTSSYQIFQNTISCTNECFPFRITDLDLDLDINNLADCNTADGDWASDGTNNACYFCTKYGGEFVNPDAGILGEEYCLYDAVPSEGVSCPASAASCREYKGNAATNIRTALFDDFERGTLTNWLHGEISNEALVVTGHSLKSSYFVGGENRVSTEVAYLSAGLTECNPNIASQCDSSDPLVDNNCYNPDTGYCQAIDSNGTNGCNVAIGEQYCSTINNVMDSGRSYLLSFWGKSDSGENESIEVRIDNNPLPANWTLGDVILTPEWQHYTIGPIYTSEDENVPEHIFTSSRLLFTLPDVASDADLFYLDNIEIKEVSQYTYLIKDSWQTPLSCDTNPLLDLDLFPPPNAPQYMLGCEEYSDYYGRTNYLKSFSKLCREAAVGCEAFIDTHNSTSPYEEIYNGQGDPFDPTLSNSDILVPQDSITYLVNDSSKQCSSQAVGCQALGLPVIDPDTGQVQSTYSTYLINNPDDYSSILCGEEEYGCEEFTTADGLYYFKDPGSRLCRYKQIPNQQNYGWFKSGSTSQEPDCPAEETLLGVQRPSKACQGGDRSGLTCEDNSQCPQGSCVTWVGSCPQEEDSCSEYIDPISEISENILFNGSFEQNIDVTDSPDIPDGWVATGATNASIGNSAGVDGSQAVRSVVNFSDSVQQFDIPLKPNTLYTLSGDIKQGTTNGDARIIIYRAETGCGDYTLCPANLVSPDNSLVLFPAIGVTVNTNARISIDSTNLSESEFTHFSGRFYSGNALSIDIIFGERYGTGNPPNSETGHWFDNISITETGVYYYLDNSVDKSGCNGLVDYEKGCVLFNNRGNVNYSIGELDISYLLFNADQSPTESGVASTECVNVCNTDELIKVRPDRVCGEWLNCSSTVKNVTETGIEEDYCVALNNCASLDANGNCDYVIPSGDLENQTEPYADANRLRNLSGYSKAGINWGNTFGTNEVIQGYYHYGEMPQRGELAQVPNGNFEEYYNTKQPVGWSDPWGSPWSSNQFKVINDPIDAQQKEGITIVEGKSILKLGSSFFAGSEYFDVFPNTEYILTGKINTLNLKPAEAFATIQVAEPEVRDNYLDPAWWRHISAVAAGSDWTEVSVRFNTEDLNQIIVFAANWLDTVDDIPVPLDICDDFDGTPGCDLEGSSYFDEIRIRPVLENKNNPINYIAPSCRVYPENSSLSCDYFDDSGLEHRGINGYCLMHDPQNSNICLQWWPVDLIKGDTFGGYSGYSGRTPLYYCLGSSPGVEESIVQQDVNTGSFINQVFMFNIENANAPLNSLINSVRVRYYHAGGLNCSGPDCWSSLALVPGMGDRVMFSSGILYNVYTDNDEDCPIDYSYPVDRGVSRAAMRDFMLFIDDDGYPDVLWLSTQDCSEDADARTAVYEIEISYTTPQCTLLAKVATSSGDNKAWLGRVTSGSSYEVPALNYSYSQDYAPFGSLVAPDPVDNPLVWDGSALVGLQPLNVETPDVDNFSQPYQARAGTPYSCLGDACNVARCSNTNDFCAFRGDCPDAGICEPYSYPASVQNNALAGVSLLQRLFAKSYGIWVWNGTQYDIVEGYEWSEPTAGCWETLPFENSRNNKIFPNDFCGVAPMVENISVNNISNGNVNIVNSSSVSLSFNSAVDANQLPVTSYRVDWGDGYEISVTGTSLRDKSNPENPYNLAHVYSYWDVLSKNDDSDDIYCFGEDSAQITNWPNWITAPALARGSCAVVPRIQIIDNWGWCNGNIDYNTGLPFDDTTWGYFSNGCQNQLNAWTYYPNVVIISNN